MRPREKHTENEEMCQHLKLPLPGEVVLLSTRRHQPLLTSDRQGTRGGLAPQEWQGQEGFGFPHRRSDCTFRLVLLVPTQVKTCCRVHPGACKQCPSQPTAPGLRKGCGRGAGWVPPLLRKHQLGKPLCICNAGCGLDLGEGALPSLFRRTRNHSIPTEHRISSKDHAYGWMTHF